MAFNVEAKVEWDLDASGCVGVEKSNAFPRVDSLEHSLTVRL